MNPVDDLNQTLKKQFGKQNEILQQMLDIMPRPESKAMRIFGLFVLFCGSMSILTAIEIVRQWIIGG